MEKNIAVIWGDCASPEIVRQALREKVYPGTRWISTGISKGGQTVVYHRYFYPDDVEVSVPYVAPINLEYIDPRLEKFLDKLGDTPENRDLLGEGGKEQKWQIFDFQKRCFERLAELQPLFDAYVDKRGYTYERVGGRDMALKMVILEFPFAFWQWGNDINEMPEEGVDTIEEWFAYLVKVSSPDFFCDQSIEGIQAFYYAALTETGMYAYNIKPFKKYFPRVKKQITFRYALPEGYDTEMGQGGVNVSGGQKQRICIARALLKKPKVLILDDSTSAVDTATERKIRERMAEYLPFMTKIIIAQRISSVRSADQIVILDDGKISDVGTHEELLGRSEIYRQIYESQKEGVEL